MMPDFDTYPGEASIGIYDENYSRRLVDEAVAQDFNLCYETISGFRPLNAFLEEALQLPFTSTDLKNVKLGVPELYRLREAEAQYNSQFVMTKPGLTVLRYPERGDDLRVSIPRTRRVVGTDRTIGQASITDPSKLLTEVRRALLFCNSILVDFPNFPEPTNAQWIERGNCILQAYGEISELLPARVVIPFAHRDAIRADFADPWRKWMGVLNLPPKDEQMVRSIMNGLDTKFPSLSLRDAKAAVLNALLEQQASQDSFGAFDPYIRSIAAARAHAEALRVFHRPFVSKDVAQPVNLAYLSTNFAIDPSKVSNSDLLSMRRNEEIFTAWRIILRETLDHLRSVDELGLDQARELQGFVNDRVKDWRSRARPVMGRGAMASVADFSKDAAWSLVTGCVTGSLVNTKSGLAMAGLTPVAKQLLQFFGRLTYDHLAVRGGRRGRVAFDNHLLAIGAK